MGMPVAGGVIVVVVVVVMVMVMIMMMIGIVVCRQSAVVGQR